WPACGPPGAAELADDARLVAARPAQGQPVAAPPTPRALGGPAAASPPDAAAEAIAALVDRAAQDAAAGAAADAVPAGVAGNDALLHLLRQLPAAFPRAPRIWVPRSLRQQVASILRALTVDATARAGAEAGGAAAEAAHRLCGAATQLLLRAAVDETEPGNHDEQELRASSGSNAILRARIRSAVGGDWTKLVRDSLHDLASAATVKIRHGSARGGRDILVGSPRVPPGPAADEGAQTLFHTDPLEPADEVALREALAAAAAMPKKKRLKVTLRLVGRQAAAIRRSFAHAKFAMGTCLLGAGMLVAGAVGERQYGAGRCAGTQLEIAEVRAAARTFPHRALIGLDIKNAVGQVRWADALKAAVAEAPMVAAPMAILCWELRVEVFLSDANGKGWHSCFIHGSLIQGNQEGHPAFCMVIAVVWHVVVNDPRLQPCRLEIRHWLYVDDWLMQAPLVIAVQWKRLRRPALPGDARALAARVPYRLHGLNLLGTEARGDLAMPLYAAGVPKQTQQRLDRAIRLADAALEMMRLAPPARAKQAAFALRRGIVAHALDYDAGVLPCSALLPHARVLDQSVVCVVAASIDLRPDQLTEAELQQISLPVWYAGLQVDVPSRIVPLARAARLVEHGPALRAEITSWAARGGAEAAIARDAKQYDGVDDAVADGILDMLRDCGFAALAGRGRPASDLAESASDPLRPEGPEQHLLSKYLQHSAAARYADLLEGAAARDRTRLLSAAGPTAGSTLTAELSLSGVALADREWVEAVRFRLGIPTPCPPGAQCLIEKTSTQELCLEQLDAHGDHAAGGYVRRELFVPELTTSRAEVWLDVWAYGVAELPDCLVDVTVRHPMSVAYQPGAAREPGSAARAAESEKDDRYPPAGGRAVWPAAHETFGCLGARAEALLEHCAAAHARRAHRRGRLPGNALRRWRAQLDAALMQGVAAQLLAARCGVPRRPRRRAALLSARQLEARSP
ncbi:unnamed protein product, partial [Prorocentrum cordatum]